MAQPTPTTIPIPGFPSWTQTPIPGLSLSAGGLLALADLSTVAQRTALRGGSSWLDSLLLVPGLHYQQAADELARGTAGEGTGLDGSQREVKNAATVAFLQRVARAGETVVLDVGRREGKEGDEVPGLGWLSHVLYLASPVLTAAALAIAVLIQDWWVLGCLIALMLSRVLNIWVIKQRSAAPSTSPQTPSFPPSSSSSSSSTDHSQLHRQRRRRERQRLAAGLSSSSSSSPRAPATRMLVTLPDGRSVCLRGTAADLDAVTTRAWLREKTHVESYLEAIAKLLVHLVAAVSGNWTQAGGIVVIVLLLASAGLLALSNAHAKGMAVNGRVAGFGRGLDGVGRGGRGGGGGGRGGWLGSGRSASSDTAGIGYDAERGQGNGSGFKGKDVYTG